MRSSRSRQGIFAASMLACVVVVASIAGVSGGDDDDKRRAETTGTAQVLPPIGQFGTEPAPASHALTTIEFTMDPPRPGAMTEIVRRPANADGTFGKREVYATLKQGELGTVHVNVKRVGASGRPYRYYARSGGRRTNYVLSNAAEWDAGFQDEFAGTSLDRSVWRTRVNQTAELNKESSGEVICEPGDPAGVKGVNRSRNPNTDRAVVVRNGIASLEVDRIKECGSGAGWRAVHESGHIGTGPTDGFEGRLIGGDGGTYVIAARLRLAQTRGNHGGFWTRGLDPTPKLDVNEIDVIESFGEGSVPNCGDKEGEMRVLRPKGANSTMTSNVYRAYSPHRGIKACLGADNLRGIDEHKVKPWNAYRVYSVEWSREGYKFRIDGELTRILAPEMFDPDYVSTRQVFLVLSNNVQNMCGDLGERVQCAPDVDNPNSALRVDWVRTWKAR